ncbi:MAG: hypothetical protein AAF531_18435 [Actinomycetota bacterium]
MRTSTAIIRLSILLALGLLAAACGSDGDDSAATAAPAAEDVAEETEDDQADPADEGADDADGASDEPTEEQAEEQAEQTDEQPAGYSGEVAALVVRRVTGELEQFTTTRDDYVADLEAQDGVVADREFQTFLSFTTFAEPDPAVYIGLTEGRSTAEFSGSADAVDPALSAAYFPTFEIEVFDLLAPLDETTAVDITEIAAADGQVLEIAWRDLNAYDNFDQTAYETARDDYLDALSAFDGWVAEYQWVSSVGSGIVVGMTVYEDAEAFQTIATDADFTASDVYQAFVGGYPIQGGYASLSVKP